MTGASGAIGRAISVALAEVGADLCLVGRDEARLRATAADVRGHDAKVVSVVADLTLDESIDELTVALRRGLGGLDILVSSAGIYARGDISEAGTDILDVLYRTNVRAPYRLIHELLPMIVDRRGDVVFVNSTQGLSASGKVGQYAATQHGMRAVADSLRAEVNASDVRVTTIHVGRTASPVQERIFQAEERPYTPDRLIHPADIAELVVAAVALPRRAQVTSFTIWPTART